MAKGQFFKSGGQMFTTYDATSEGCKQLINDFYDGGWQAFYSSFARSAGSPVFDGGLNNTGYSGGFFNPKFGMDVTAAMFTSKKVSSALPKRAYDHEGMRLLTQYATYGTAKEFQRFGQPVFGTWSGDTWTPGEGGYGADDFLGLGAATYADGPIMDSVSMTYDMIRIPAKELPLPYDFGLMLKALETKDDDTAAYKQYIDQIGNNYADLMDKTILRDIHLRQPTRNGQETSLNGLARIFSSGEEVGVGDNIGMILPWGGINGDMAGGYNGQMSDGQGRATGFTYDTDGVITAANHTKNNYDSQIVDADGAVPTLGMFDELYMKCMVNWDDDYNNKFWLMSPLEWMKLNQLSKANQIYNDSVYSTLTISGMKTPEGRDYGWLLNSYQNIPIIMSGNMAFDYGGKTVNTAKYGETMLIDGQHVWMCVLSPVEVWNVENPAITRDLKEKNLTHMRAELRADKFISSGRLKNVGQTA